jgi:nitric oxide dioxygenase
MDLQLLPQEASVLSPETIAIIKATIPALQEHGETLTRHFYRRMFNANPQVKAFFNPAHQHAGTQQRALAAAICAYATHIENPSALGPAVELIAQKHASLDVKAEHYPIVGEHLLASIREVLGEAATENVINAWAQAYGVLADILIRREGEIYDEHRKAHGWSGFKPFVVSRKQRESATITSFYLTPADGERLHPFQAGQYVTVRVPGTWHQTTLRNYSLSGGPSGSYYRISVKREPAPAGRSLIAPAGHVSNYLHDRVGEGDRIELAPPCGEFVLGPRPADNGPLVLISGGVGVTPMLAMLHAALARGDAEARDVWFIHGAANGDAHAFAGEVDDECGIHPRLRVHVRYSEPTLTDRQECRHHSEGVMDGDLLRMLLASPEGEFYYCGPRQMMSLVHSGLLAWDVKPAQMHYEFFGPAQDLRAAGEPPRPLDLPTIPDKGVSASKPCCGKCAAGKAEPLVPTLGRT